MDQCIPCTKLVKPSPGSGGSICLHSHRRRWLNMSLENIMYLRMPYAPALLPLMANFPVPVAPGHTEIGPAGAVGMLSPRPGSMFREKLDMHLPNECCWCSPSRGAANDPDVKTLPCCRAHDRHRVTLVRQAALSVSTLCHRVTICTVAGYHEKARSITGWFSRSDGVRPESARYQMKLSRALASSAGCGYT